MSRQNFGSSVIPIDCVISSFMSNAFQNTLPFKLSEASMQLNILNLSLPMQYNQQDQPDGHPGPLCPNCNEPSKSVESSKNGGRIFWGGTCMCNTKPGSQYGAFLCWDDEYVANNYQIPPKSNSGFKRKPNYQSNQPAKVARTADETSMLVMFQKIMDIEKQVHTLFEKQERELSDLCRKVEEHTELIQATNDLMKLKDTSRPIQTQMNPAKKFKSIADKA